MDPAPTPLDYLVIFMVLSAFFGGCVVYIAFEVRTQLRQYRADRQHAHVQHADQQIRDLTGQAQNEMLRLVMEARRRDGYGT